MIALISTSRAGNAAKGSGTGLQVNENMQACQIFRRIPLYAALVPRSQDHHVERREAVETNRRIARGVGAAVADHDPVASGKRQRQVDRTFLVKHVGTVAGGTGEDAGA